jgi:hypothetical protein
MHSANAISSEEQEQKCSSLGPHPSVNDWSVNHGLTYQVKFEFIAQSTPLEILSNLLYVIGNINVNREKK